MQPLGCFGRKRQEICNQTDQISWSANDAWHVASLASRSLLLIEGLEAQRGDAEMPGLAGRRWPLLFSYWWLESEDAGAEGTDEAIEPLRDTREESRNCLANDSEQASSHTVKSALLMDVSGFLATLTRRSANEDLI